MSIVVPESITFHLDSQVIAAQRWGKPGGIPVLALHGWLDNSASFELIAEKIEGYEFVALDLPGHGHSSHRPVPGSYNIWEDIGDLYAVADQLNWSKFALLGHSRGAIIATLAAGTFPERISHLALIEGIWPSNGKPDDAPQQLAQSIMDNREYSRTPPTLFATIEAAVRARKKGFFGIDEEAARRLAKRGVSPADGGFIWNNDQRLKSSSALKLPEEYVRGFVKRITAATLLIMAEDGLLTDLDEHRARLDCFNNLTVEKLPGDHFLHMHQSAGDVALLIDRFLKGDNG